MADVSAFGDDDQLRAATLRREIGRLGPFFLLSVLCHLAWMSLDFPSPSMIVRLAASPLLRVQLQTPAEMPHDPQAPAHPTRHLEKIVTGGKHTSATDDQHTDATVESSASANQARDSLSTPAMDLDALRATARAIAREIKPKPALAGSSPAVLPSIETAITGALISDTPVESKGPEGWVIRRGKVRCIILPKDIPYFRQGTLIVPQCG